MSEQQPTPETDAVWANSWDEGGHHPDTMLDHARRLERERDEARKLAEDLAMWDPQQRKLPWIDKVG